MSVGCPCQGNLDDGWPLHGPEKYESEMELCSRTIKGGNLGKRNCIGKERELSRCKLGHTCLVTVCLMNVCRFFHVMRTEIKSKKILISPTLVDFGISKFIHSKGEFLDY